MLLARVSIARRAFALIALLATLSGALAPVCAESAAVQPTAGHCGTSSDHGMPDRGAPTGSTTHHHAPIVCATGMCLAAQVAATPAVAPARPVVLSPSSVEPVLVSAAPQHTTPPPRA